MGLHIPNLDRKLAGLLDAAFVVVGTSIALAYAIGGSQHSLGAPVDDDEEVPSPSIREARASMLRALSSTAWLGVGGLTLVRLVLLGFGRLWLFWILLAVQLGGVTLWGEALRDHRREGRSYEGWRTGRSKFTRGLMLAFGFTFAALLGRGCLDLPFP